jgi:type IV pilus assembly protein PilE
MRFVRGDNHGFTLVEIIIVIIIVGVLASLALPRFFSTVEYSRSTEALTNLSAIRQAMERCYLQRSSFVNCRAFANLDLEDPGSSPNSHFIYSFVGGGGANNFNIRATRNTRDGGDGTSQVSLIGNITTVNRNGTTVFSGIQ